MVDLAIRNVKVLDGSGADAFDADVEVDDGRILSVGRAGKADREIDGQGACLAPGFIDTHAHDDGAFFRHPGMPFKLAQGVTSVVSGNCGFSAIPQDPERDSVAASGGILAGLEGEFKDLSGYFGAPNPSARSTLLARVLGVTMGGAGAPGSCKEVFRRLSTGR